MHHLTPIAATADTAYTLSPQKLNSGWLDRGYMHHLTLKTDLRDTVYKDHLSPNFDQPDMDYKAHQQSNFDQLDKTHTLYL
jgi:hypothetical protein